MRYFNEVWRYEAQSDEWSRIADMPAEIQLAQAVFVNGIIVLVGRGKCSLVFDPVGGGFVDCRGYLRMRS